MWKTAAHGAVMIQTSRVFSTVEMDNNSAVETPLANQNSYGVEYGLHTFRSGRVRVPCTYSVL